MKRLTLVAVLVMVSLPASALAEEAKTTKKVKDPRAVGEWTWGIKGGVNLGTFSGDKMNPSASDADPSMHLGVALGAFGTWHLSSELSLQPELYMSEKGANFKNLSDEDANEAYLYVELPIFARYDFAIDDMFNVFGVAGPTVGYIIDAKAREKDQLNLFDVGATAGLGADMKLGEYLVILEVRYNVGFLNTLDSSDDATARNRVLSFLLGFTT